MQSVFTGGLGLAVFLGAAWALSANRQRVPWRTVLWGLGLQTALALFILKTRAGQFLFDWAGRGIRALIAFANEGCAFVFGPLAQPPTLEKAFGPGQTFVFAITVAGTIILVSALSSVLYHWGVLQRVVQAMAWLMRRALRTSGSETLAAAANIFMGQTEAPLVVKPYLARMTRSELLCLMTGGMATLAGGVASVYVKLATDAGHPDFAGHLLTASVMNAPAALYLSKILLPETETSETAGRAAGFIPRTTTNSLDALCQGAADGMKLSLNVMAMLIAFVAVVALANALLVGAQSLAGVTSPANLQTLLGWLNAPLAWLMGVPAHDCLTIGSVLGERVVLNEFIGYVSLNAATVDPRSYTIAIYALCGFANFASIAIQVGGIGALVPERRGELARLGLRAMLGGLLACYVSATLAGLMI
ncbi:nucleoside transporter C-terminal domain-containing protein [Fontisphaera persica]|uniref:NupC/NupG family nucleoside CNT transporter n=1 Tax=Fontisphaera persica TaxID=2974023 RepID=UPI0024C05F17|nr:nucleoside transporter C-terminal domain-containing protein [Fontisphaera persica]WCJ59438.1 nucleoside transporter C-terminal domain-containing protein [Fontisphaera persica]